MKKNVLSIVLFCTVFFAPFSMRANDAATLAANISSFTGGGTGSLTAVASGNTVTVTGSLTGVTTQLALDIDAGVTVKWQADISMGSGFTDYGLITVSGAGTFDVATGGSVMTTIDGGIAISTGLGFTISVSGGTVSATTGGAIDGSYPGFIIINDGMVSATSGTAINNSSNTSLIVNGGVISSTTGYSITAGGNFDRGATVTINNGTVSTITGHAIFGSINTLVTVCGTGQVQATGDYSTAISTWGSVEIKDNARVSATSGLAIYSSDYSDTYPCGNVEVSGGEVSATTGIAINASGGSSKVTVSGTGKVQKTAAIALLFIHLAT